MMMVAVLAAAVWSVPEQTVAAPRRMAVESPRQISADATRRTTADLESVRKVQADWWVPRLRRMPAAWLPEILRLLRFA
jgi:hypothetical protein